MDCFQVGAPPNHRFLDLMLDMGKAIGERWKGHGRFAGPFRDTPNQLRAQRQDQFGREGTAVGTTFPPIVHLGQSSWVCLFSGTFHSPLTKPENVFLLDFIENQKRDTLKNKDTPSKHLGNLQILESDHRCFNLSYRRSRVNEALRAISVEAVPGIRET